MNIPFNIFPVGPDKAPLISGWQTKATRDAHTLAQWQTNGVQAWGIPCGATNDLFVIDLDVNKTTGERVGELQFHGHCRYRELLKHINVRTPSGGAHIYLKHFDGARNTTSKIAPKVDTRGEGGYVISPGSVTAGGAYYGTFPALSSVPLGLRAMLLRKPPTMHRALDRLSQTGEVEELLGHIPADLPYNDWLSVLMALHDRYNGTVEGLNLADRWSATGAKYRKGEVQGKWRSFKRNGVSWRTVPALARQHGANLSEIARRYV